MSKTIFSLIINAIIFLTTLVLLLEDFRADDGAWSLRKGLSDFRYYTAYSNALSGIVCGVMLIAEAGHLIHGVAVPHWTIVLKYTGTAAVTLTLVFCALFLAPKQGIKATYRGNNFYSHLIGPLLAFISLCFLENTDSIGVAEMIPAFLATAAYLLVYIKRAIFADPDNGGWGDIYGLNGGGNWKRSVAAILLLHAVICAAIRVIYNR